MADTRLVFLRLQEASLEEFLANLPIFNGFTVEPTEITVALQEGVSETSTWTFSPLEARLCFQEWEMSGAAPPAPKPQQALSSYRKKLKKLKLPLEDEELVWYALGYHIYARSQVVELPSALVPLYSRAQKALEAARQLEAVEELAVVEAGQCVATVAHSLSYCEQKLEALAATAIDAVAKDTGPYRSLEKIVKAMEHHLVLFKEAKDQLLRVQLDELSQESEAADAYMVALLEKPPVAGFLAPSPETNHPGSKSPTG